MKSNPALTTPNLVPAAQDSALTTSNFAPAHLQIAIDGPVAAGKGTVSRLVAERLGLLYVDTGAMYRCVALMVIKHHLSSDDENQIITELVEHEIKLRMPQGQEEDGRLVTVLFDGEDVSWAIRSEQVSSLTSVIAQHALVRQQLVSLQQKIGASQDVIMEGRDITHIVLPQAQLKIYLNAEPAVRAKRRQIELMARGQDVTFVAVLAELQTRDAQDQLKNLKKVAGVWELDTTDLSIAEVADMIVARATEIKQ